jgi:hypothetical protein
MKTYYAAFNRYADLNSGNRGFANSWEIARFDSRSARDEFVMQYANHAAKAVTRRDAERIYRNNYISVGRTVPPGGLFGYDGANFWQAA